MTGVRGRFLFDATLLRADCPNRGIPRVIRDILEVLLDDEALRERMSIVVTRDQRNHFLSLYPRSDVNLRIIGANPVSWFMAHGALSDFRYRFPRESFAFVFVTDFRDLVFFPTVRQVLLVYDLIYLCYWKQDLFEDFKLKRALIPAYMWYKTQKIRTADTIYAISQFTMERIQERFSVFPGGVLPLGYKEFPSYSRPAMRERWAPLTGEGFFLYVGSFDARKGVLECIGHAESLCRQTQARLVLAGATNESQQRLLEATIRDLDLAGSVRLAPNPGDKDLAYLYDHALALAYPSRMEGFGLPILEAMSRGLPVAAFRNSSIPEVAGEAALLAPDGDYPALMDALVSLHRDPSLRDRLSALGRERAQVFSRDRFRKRVLDIFRFELAKDTLH